MMPPAPRLMSALGVTSLHDAKRSSSRCARVAWADGPLDPGGDQGEQANPAGRRCGTSPRSTACCTLSVRRQGHRDLSVDRGRGRHLDVPAGRGDSGPSCRPRSSRTSRATPRGWTARPGGGRERVRRGTAARDRAVLVITEGVYGDSVYALDITDPADPAVLWRRNSRTRTWAISATPTAIARRHGGEPRRRRRPWSGSRPT